ncbi:uncharacterized protein LOC113306006 [Papaver somniferum]|uniref:uncharacterized protein LOC113306006 n=1 Tax=Papaver somniferum TaxID=3469 RepID=UPI000E6FB041|nr:uncharacterized protein LOC113306006 [Papaver somniferum]
MPMNAYDLMNSEGNWDMNVISKYIDKSSHNAINSVAINLCLHDRIRWKSTISGNLTTKSVYNFLTNVTIDKDEASFCKQIWNLNILPKVNMFCWKVVSNAIALGKNMSKYVKDSKPHCLLCDSHDIEDEMHLFVNCLFSRKIWDAFELNNIYNYRGNQDIIHWFKFWLNSKVFNGKHNLIYFIIWSIWKFRNSVQFDKAVPNVHKLIDLVKVPHQKFNIPGDNKTSHDSVTAKNLHYDNRTNGRCTYDWFIHFDASFLEADFSMGYANLNSG